MLSIKENTSEIIIDLDSNVQDIVVEENAQAYIYFLNVKDDIVLNIEQRKGSYLEVFFVNHANNIKTNVNLKGENCVSNIAGVYSLREEQKGSIDITINHNALHCESNQNFRGIARDKSRFNVNMMSYVAEGAIKTEAKQLHKAIVLSDNAKIVAKPELEIYNDDVQCAHGNTVGNLDKLAVFYLQSRGINEKLAKEMLIDGFLDEAVKSVTKDNIKNMVFDIINENQE